MKSLVFLKSLTKSKQFFLHSLDLVRIWSQISHGVRQSAWKCGDTREAQVVSLREQGISPHNEIIEIHTKFSLPVACLVFALTGLALLVLHARNRRMTWPLVSLGLLIPLILALIFIH